MRFQAACNAVTWKCGCTEWDEWDEPGGWVHRYWVCNQDEMAAARGWRR